MVTVQTQIKSQIKLAPNNFARRKQQIIAEVKAIDSADSAINRKKALDKFCAKYDHHAFNADLQRFECVKSHIFREGVVLWKIKNKAYLFDLLGEHELWFVYKDDEEDIIMLEFR